MFLQAAEFKPAAVQPIRFIKLESISRQPGIANKALYLLSIVASEPYLSISYTMKGKALD